MLTPILKALKFLGIVFSTMLLVYLALLVFAPISFSPTVDSDPSLPSVSLNGHKFHAETFGNPNNPILLALHGGPGGDYLSIRSLKALADKYFVIMYDQRKSGLSSRNSEVEITVQSFFDDLNSFIEHFDNGKPVNIVGHSWGAMLASGYAGMYPEKVNKLVLIEPGILKAELAGPYLNAARPEIGFVDYIYLSGVWLNKWRVDINSDEEARDDYFMSQLYIYFENKDLSNEFVGWRIGTFVQRQTIGKMVRDPELLASLDFLKGVENFEGEVLFLSSENNKIYGANYQRRHLKYYKSATHKIVYGAGHHIFIDQPDLSNQIIDDFLSDNDGKL